MLNVESSQKKNKKFKKVLFIPSLKYTDWIQLPFKKMCQMKYDKMGIDFPFAHIPEPSPDAVMAEEERLNKLIK